ncbi:MAG: sulfite exporter TauE/SafE family protein [Bacteroidota bacterium]
MDFMVPVIAGFVLGCLHAFDVDHVVAVTAFTSKHPSERKAAVFGLLWGLGHTVSLMLFGLVTLALKVVIPPLVESLAELAVGVLLVGIGIWVLKDVLMKKRIHMHTHHHDGVEHVHFHSHQHTEHHTHRHSMFLIGATHGLAGTASVMVLIPITLTQSLLVAGLYLLLFGIGTIVAMMLFAYLLGKVSSTTLVQRALPVFQGTAGIISVGIGSIWIGNQLM